MEERVWQHCLCVCLSRVHGHSCQVWSGEGAVGGIVLIGMAWALEWWFGHAIGIDRKRLQVNGRSGHGAADGLFGHSRKLSLLYSHISSCINIRRGFQLAMNPLFVILLTMRGKLCISQPPWSPPEANTPPSNSVTGRSIRSSQSQCDPHLFYDCCRRRERRHF